MWLYKKTIGLGNYDHIEWIDLIYKKDITEFVYKFKFKRYLYITDLFSKFEVDYKETEIEYQSDKRHDTIVFLEDGDMYKYFQIFGCQKIIINLFK